MKTTIERIPTEGGDVYCVRNSPSGSIVGFFKNLKLAEDKCKEIEEIKPIEGDYFDGYEGE